MRTKIIFILFLLILSLSIVLPISSGSLRPENVEKVPSFLELKPLYSVEEYELVISKLKEWEGYRPTVYLDSKGYAIGYGHVLKKFDGHLFSATLSEYEADSILREDFDNMMDYAYKLTRLEGSRLLSVSALLFNVGTYEFSKSRLLKKVLSNDSNIEKEWLSWCHYYASGLYIRSGHLLKRRVWEYNMYKTGYEKDYSFGYRHPSWVYEFPNSKTGALFLFGDSDSWVPGLLYLRGSLGSGGAGSLATTFWDNSIGPFHDNVPLREGAFEIPLK